MNKHCHVYYLADVFLSVNGHVSYEQAVSRCPPFACNVIISGNNWADLSEVVYVLRPSLHDGMCQWLSLAGSGRVDYCQPCWWGCCVELEWRLLRILEWRLFMDVIGGFMMRSSHANACRITGPCCTIVTCRCPKNFSQWERSFLWKLRCHWLKSLQQRQIAVVWQGSG